jgi:hypothetical protein
VLLSPKLSSHNRGVSSTTHKCLLELARRGPSAFLSCANLLLLRISRFPLFRWVRIHVGAGVGISVHRCDSGDTGRRRGRRGMRATSLHHVGARWNRSATPR